MRRGPLLVLLCYVLWGVLPIYWKLIADVSAYVNLGSRAIWSFILCIIILAALKKLNQVKRIFADRREVWRLFIAGGVLLINWGSYIIAVNTNHIVDASLAYYLNPIISIVIGFTVFKERLTGLQWAGVILATVGVGISIISYGQVPWLALVIGLSFAVYGALKKTCHSESISALTVEMTPYILPLLVFVTVMFAKGQAGDASLWQLLLLPTTGIVTAVPLFFYSTGIASTDYTLAGILMYVNPTLQLLCGTLLYGEVISRAQWLTFLFVWAGLICYVVSILLKRHTGQPAKK
ncbi:EamA family transporter RarD [Peptococcus simiae]|uniref:EamA family transporter RarD n=1 Tax=Peptococcus simiae TaxID=1643805 RepID=UPI00397EECB5